MAKAGLLFAGTEDGLVLLSNPNEIGRWLKIGQPFRGSAVRAVWALPDQPLTVFAGVAGAGLQRSDDGGQSWQALLPDAPQLLLGGAQSGELFAAAGPALLSSRDAGATWQSATPDPAGSMGALARGAAPGQLYCGVGRRVLASADGGASWRELGGELAADVAGIAAPQQQPGQLYAVAGGQLYSSVDGGAWRLVAGAPGAAGPLAALPGKATALLLALAAGGIARSADGTSWEVADASGPIGALVPAGYHVDTAFAGGAEGALLGSTDRGRSWAALRPGLPPILCVAGARLL
jgi:photosystem II stability/assembly factor-like uncharacterized protein